MRPMSRKQWIKQRATAWLIGGAVLAAVAVLHSLRVFDPLIYLHLDHAFKFANRIDASDQIVMIDIDDTAVKRIKGWPWPRRMYAELIDCLSELGAERVLLDFLFDVPQAPRLEHPNLQPDVDVAPDQEVFGAVDLGDAIRDDDEFAAAMARAGNVYLAFYFTPSPPGVDLEQLNQAIQNELSDQPQATLESIISSAVPSDAHLPADFDIERFATLSMLTFYLGREFSLTLDELAARTALPRAQAEVHFAEAKRIAARRIVLDVLTAEPHLSFADVMARVLPEQAYDEHNADREDVLRAYRVAKGELAGLFPRPPVPDDLAGLIPTGWDATPPLEKLASAARSVGYVTFENDPEYRGGIFRRVPLVIDLHDHLVPQLGFSMACDHLGIDWEHALQRDGRFLKMTDDAGESYRVKLDEGGRMLINWHYNRAADNPADWTNSFTHIPVTMIYQLAAIRSEIDENRRRYGQLMAEWIARQAPGEFQKYAANVVKRNQLARSLRTERTSSAEREEIESQISELEKATSDVERSQLENLTVSLPSADQESQYDADTAAIIELGRRVLDARGVMLKHNALLSAHASQLLDDLRPRIEGKLCFLGYTATAVADIVNSPVYQKMPGVLAHANVVNDFLQNGFVWTAAPWTSYLLLVICGTVVTLATARFSASVNLPVMVAVAGAAVAVSYGVFASRGIYLASVPAVVGAFLCWAFVTLYRLLAEERLRRRFARSLARNTSPALARQIAETAEDLSLEPRPEEVSCLFSDLAGFTTISERLGPDHTQAILNRYLQTMSDVLLPHQAINKFMGDGIFAFFNAPVWPCADHAKQAIEAALDCRDALAKLKADEADGQFAAEFAALQMRVGINSGTAFVGEFGSDHQIDYTCIGDSINLGARLEPANKAFGTTIMVSEFSRAAANGDYAFRHLGGLQVKGKRLAVPVYELIGRSSELDHTLNDFVQAFEDGVACFQHRDWAGAAAAFKRCEMIRPADAGVELYRRQIVAYQGAPPPDDWNRAIELTTK